MGMTLRERLSKMGENSANFFELILEDQERNLVSGGQVKVWWLGDTFLEPGARAKLIAEGETDAAGMFTIPEDQYGGRYEIETSHKMGRCKHMYVRRLPIEGIFRVVMFIYPSDTEDGKES